MQPSTQQYMVSDLIILQFVKRTIFSWLLLAVDKKTAKTANEE